MSEEMKIEVLTSVCFLIFGTGAIHRVTYEINGAIYYSLIRSRSCLFGEEMKEKALLYVRDICSKENWELELKPSFLSDIFSAPIDLKDFERLSNFLDPDHLGKRIGDFGSFE